MCDIVLLVHKCDTSSRSPFASLQLSRFIVIFTFLILFMRGVDGHVSVGDISCETMFTECFSMKLNGILSIFRTNCDFLDLLTKTHFAVSPNGSTAGEFEDTSGQTKVIKGTSLLSSGEVGSQVKMEKSCQSEMFLCILQK